MTRAEDPPPTPTLLEPSKSSAAPELRFSLPSGYVVRAVPSTFAHALRRKPVDISVEDARTQHAAYVQALRDTGAPVMLLPADDSCPDCCFIEDTALVLGQRALITRPGAPSRRAEVVPVRTALGRTREIFAMDAPATLDGGDVLRVGRKIFVGLSERTNPVGTAWAAEVASLEGIELITVPVTGGLHLKSVCSLAAPDLLVYIAGACDPRVFRDHGIECLAVPEPEGANVLALGHKVLVSADAPLTIDLLMRRGLIVKALHITEFHRADGALTCLSLRLPPTGCWVS